VHDCCAAAAAVADAAVAAAAAVHSGCARTTLRRTLTISTAALASGARGHARGARGTHSLAGREPWPRGGLIGLEQRKAKNRAARAFKAQCKEVHDGTTMVGAEDLVSQQDFFSAVKALKATPEVYTAILVNRSDLRKSREHVWLCKKGFRSYRAMDDRYAGWTLYTA